MAASTVFSGVKITWLGHSSVMLEADGLVFYVDPYVLPPGSKTADAILYTHGHFDHAAPAPSITKSTTITIGHNVKLPVRSIEIGGREKLGGVIVEAVHAYNLARPMHPRDAGAGYIIAFKTARVYVAGDTDFIPEMKGYKCDIAIVPISAAYTMDELQAADAIAAMMPKVAIPYHYGYLTEAKGDPEKFKAAIDAKTGGKVDVRILVPSSR
ncbi:Beta-lactamase superfamily domain protein [uncultured archaeon]|nr:Beta-lactamase superfamily domain protein [uncultured archaeon]